MTCAWRRAGCAPPSASSRLRLRDRTGIVVFDAAHPDQPPHGEHDDEVETAAAGHVVRKLTRVNRDEVDATSAIGARAVEAYLPVHAGGGDYRVVGVLEIYLPYAPIQADVIHREMPQRTYAIQIR